MVEKQGSERLQKMQSKKWGFESPQKRGQKVEISKDYIRCGQRVGDGRVNRRCVTRVSSFFGALEYELRICSGVGTFVTLTLVKLTTGVLIGP